MKKHLPKFIILFTLFFPTLLSAQSTTNSDRAIPEKLEEYLQAAARMNRFNGTALIARKGKILLQKGYGFRNVQSQTFNDTNSIYQLGSITKTFTGAIILQLQEEKKLSLDDKLSKYLPDYPNGDRITINHLFFHTSGIYDFKNLLYGPDSAKLTQPVSKEWLVAQFKDKPLTTKPGDDVQYTNSGYFLLGLIVEKVTGKPFETAVRERFLTPLHLTRTGFDLRNLNDPGKTTGYTYWKDSALVAAPLTDSTVGYAAGGMYSTVGDLYRWSRVIQDRRMLKLQTWEAAFNPPKEGSWGYGWGISHFEKDKKRIKLIFQNGNLPGFATFFIQSPVEDITLILLANVDDVSDVTSLEPTVSDLINLLFDQPYQLPKNRKAIPLSETALRQYVGSYQMTPERTMVLTLESGRLFLQVTGQAKFEVFAESETDFFLKAVEAQLTFQTDSAGNVSRVVIHQGGRDYSWKRLK